MDTRVRTLIDRGLGSDRAVSSSTTIARALDDLLASPAGAVGVCEADADVVGILTGRSLIRRVAELGPDPWQQPVSRAMSRSFLVADCDLTVREALRELRVRQVNRLVATDDGRFAGILSVRELSTWLAAELERELHELSVFICGPSSIPPPPPDDVPEELVSLRRH